MRASAGIPVVLAIGGLVAGPSSARADGFNPAPPSGPGTEKSPTGLEKPGLHQGFEGSVGIGSGFSDTYGLAMEGRLGYSFEPGIYAGGAISYFIGQTVDSQSAHATFLGGELGYKYYPTPRIEIRPYVFMGPAFITQVNISPFFVASKTDFAVQPSGMVMYHAGDAFVGADVRWLVTPSPNTLAVLASGGIGF